MLTDRISPVPAPPEPLAPAIADQWRLDRRIAYLNHGCFGARPRVVSDAQAAWGDRYEARPIDFLERNRDRLIGEAKAAVGSLLGMRPENFGFVTNATGGVAAVLRSLDLSAGDEVVTTNHVYNAVRQTLLQMSERSGLTYREVDLPLPISTADDVVATLRESLGERTRLLLVDHISSPTAVVFPIERILAMSDEMGVDVLIDGAHAPGMIDLDIEGLAPAYYAANLHKWLCAPTGAAVLWARPDRRQRVHPLTISHFFGEGFAEEFAWQGTRDITPWLSAPAAIEYFAELGWDRVRDHNHRLATWVHRLLCTRWGQTPATPLDGSMIGSMATVRLPDPLQDLENSEELHDLLYDRYAIELPVIPWRDEWWIRASCHVYNTADQYERLADVIVEIAEARRGRVTRSA